MPYPPHRSLVVVDVQSTYTNDEELVAEIAQVAEECANQPMCDEVLVLFNGDTHFGPPFPTEDELREWYFLQGAESLAEADFFDKGYAFFRGCMDEGFSHDAIVPIVAYMYKNRIFDSRDLDFEALRDAGVSAEWDEFLIQFLEDEREMLFVTELMSEMAPLSEPVAVVGGAREECLAEVLIALEALGKEYVVIEELTY